MLKRLLLPFSYSQNPQESLEAIVIAKANPLRPTESYPV
jgi:hypothetical protein